MKLPQDGSLCSFSLLLVHSSFLCGASIQICGALLRVLNIGRKITGCTGDPWNGRTLEWSIPSPPPTIILQKFPRWIRSILFGLLKEVKFLTLKDATKTSICLEHRHGFYIGIFACIFGFAMTWHIFWLAIITFIAIIATVIIRLSGNDEHEVIPAAEVKKDYEKHVRSEQLA